MTLFWILTAAMIVVALALLAPTLLRKSDAGSETTEQQFNVEIAREHLAELVKQKDRGELSDEEFAQARKDVELALAEDLGGKDDTAPTAGSGGRWALIAAAVIIPAVTLPVYLEIGSPGLIERPPVQAQAPSGHGEGDLPPIGDLAQQLRERMEANPENAEGWFLLGRTYMRLQDYPGAVYAFERVVTLLPDEAAGMLSLADALAMQNNRVVPDRAVDLLKKALSLDPDSVTALWLLGNAAADRGQTSTALEYWNKASPLLDGEPSMQAELGQMIRTAGGTPPPGRAPLPPIAAPAAPVAAPAAPATDTGGSEPASTAAADGGAAITVEVALAPHLMEQATPTDTVFVLARAESGPPMPLAVSRHQVGELPLRVTLTDAMAMMPAMRLSAFPRVKISAKVSKTGQAGTQSGDLLAGDVVVESAKAPDSVQLLINQVAE